MKIIAWLKSLPLWGLLLIIAIFLLGGILAAALVHKVLLVIIAPVFWFAQWLYPSVPDPDPDRVATYVALQASIRRREERDAAEEAARLAAAKDLQVLEEREEARKRRRVDVAAKIDEQIDRDVQSKSSEQLQQEADDWAEKILDEK